MNRRTFVLLSGAAARAVALPRQSRPLPFNLPEVGQLRFALDDGRRWSLSYVTDVETRVLIKDAEIGAWIADRFVTLADLQYSAAGDRRLPTGRSLVLRGRAAGVWMEAEFFASASAATGIVKVHVYPEQAAPALGGVRFFQSPLGDLIPGSGALVALVSGYDSSSPTQVLDTSAGDLASHGTLGLTRGETGLGLAFDAEDAGDGVATCTQGTLDAASRFAPPRTLRSGGDTSTLRVSYDPAGDGLSALRTVFLPDVRVDRDRLAAAVAPTGWRPVPGSGVADESAFTSLLDACRGLDARYCHSLELGFGYQRSVGDWDTNERFPPGHRALTDQVHARGLVAGLWLAPFVVSERSGIPDSHDAWLLKRADGTPHVWDGSDAWGGALFALDGAHPEVQHWLTDLAHRATSEWGYDYLTLDWLTMATVDATRSGVTRGEAYRAGLAALRQGAGPDTFLAANNAPLQHSGGLVNSMRVVSEGDAGWSGLRAAVRTAAHRSFYHRGAWLNDSGLPGGASDDAEAQLRASLAAVLGGLTFSSDDLTALSADRLEVIARAMPAAAAAGRPIGGDTDRAPSAWITEGAPGWWTLVLVNWSDDVTPVSATFEALGLPSVRCTAYDVWQKTPLPDVTTAVGLTLDPHRSVTVGLRVASTSPQVVGSTRHVVQGSELTGEAWNAAARTLQATASRLDRRPYSIVVAVPAGLEAVECAADPACTLTTLASGHAALAWPAGEGGEINWTLRFRSSRG
ncbi:MAG TPA: alpha-galactosidase [Gemmatimonadales bacterium]|nr:alpha-galactosidase [Gemmatimonadales bacterium]